MEPHLWMRRKRRGRRKRRRRRSAYVVVPGGPGWVELHVELSLLAGQLVVLGLLLPGQRVPLQGDGRVHTPTFTPEKS